MMSRKERALIRPATVSRIAIAVMAAILSFVVLAESASFAEPGAGNGPILLWFPCAMAIVIGLLWNAIRNQGAWLLDHAVVVEAVMGRAVIPLGDIVAVHIDEAMTTLGVQTSTRYVVQSIVAPLALGVRAGAKDRTVRLFHDTNIRCVWHAGLADVYAVAAAKSPFMWPGAVLGTLRRPLVWGTALAGLAWGLYLM